MQRRAAAGSGDPQQHPADVDAEAIADAEDETNQKHAKRETQTKQARKDVVLSGLLIIVVTLATFSATRIFLNTSERVVGQRSSQSAPFGTAAAIKQKKPKKNKLDTMLEAAAAAKAAAAASGLDRVAETKPIPTKEMGPKKQEQTQQEQEEQKPKPKPTHEEPPHEEPPKEQQPPPQTQTPLPKWITDYVKWHREMRAKFPGDDLFTNEKAPKLLVRTCLGLCGGLHDRLGQLPWDIYVAARLKRVLLIAWQRPKELENFLLPPDGTSTTLAIDWRIPVSEKFGFPDIKRVRSEVPELFDGYPERNPGEGDFWRVGFEEAMIRAGAEPAQSGYNGTIHEADPKYDSPRYLRHRLLGHLDEDVLESRLELEGYYQDEINHKASDLHTAPTFGAVWELFFRPSPAVRTEIVDALGTMGLLAEGADGTAAATADTLPATKTYDAVHCRVRHPKAHRKGEVVKGKNDNYPADKTGLPWIEGGDRRAFALETAQTALVCAKEIGNADNNNDNNEITKTKTPVYFLSDSNDLVHHVASELSNTTYLDLHGSNTSWVHPDLLETVRAQTIVARNVSIENAHIDRQKGRDPPAYYATFVDLYLAMRARCVVYGIGYYAAFAAKISGTPCTYLYARESWGEQVQKNAGICPNTVAATGSENEKAN